MHIRRITFKVAAISLPHEDKKFFLRKSFRVSSNGARRVKLASHLRSIGDQFRPRDEGDLRATYCEPPLSLFPTIGDSVRLYVIRFIDVVTPFSSVAR